MQMTAVIEVTAIIEPPRGRIAVELTKQVNWVVCHADNDVGVELARSIEGIDDLTFPDQELAVVAIPSFREPRRIETDYRNDNILYRQRGHIGKAVSRDRPSLSAEVGHLKGTVGFLTLRQCGKVIAIESQNRVNCIVACQRGTRTLEA